MFVEAIDREVLFAMALDRAGEVEDLGKGSELEGGVVDLGGVEIAHQLAWRFLARARSKASYFPSIMEALLNSAGGSSSLSL